MSPKVKGCGTNWNLMCGLMSMFKINNRFIWSQSWAVSHLYMWWPCFDHWRSPKDKGYDLNRNFMCGLILMFNRNNRCSLSQIWIISNLYQSWPGFDHWRSPKVKGCELNKNSKIWRKINVFNITLNQSGVPKFKGSKTSSQSRHMYNKGTKLTTSFSYMGYNVNKFTFLAIFWHLTSQLSSHLYQSTHKIWKQTDKVIVRTMKCLRMWLNDN